MLTSVRSCTRCISRQRAGRWRRRRRSARYARALEKQERRKERALEKATGEGEGEGEGEGDGEDDREGDGRGATERAMYAGRRRVLTMRACLSLPCAHASGLWH